MHTKTKKIILGALLLASFFLAIPSNRIFDDNQVQAQGVVPPVIPTNRPVIAPVPSGIPGGPIPSPSFSTTTQQSQKELNTIIEVLIIVEKAFLALSVPLNIVIGKLLSNDWVYLDGDSYKAIETIWILMRNLVNIVFAALLLVIAIAQIAGAVSGSESKTFALKQALPGFIFGLIFVNFSLLACRVILDVGNLATTAAFSIVNEVGPNLIANGAKGADYEKVMLNKSFCWPSKKGLEHIDGCKSSSGSDGTALSKCIDEWALPAKTEWRTCMGKKVYIAFGKDQVQSLQENEDGSRPINEESWTGPNPGEPGDFAMAWSKESPDSLATSLFGARNVMMVYTNSIFRLPEILTLYNDKTNTLIGTGTGVLMTTLLSLIFGAMIIFINVALVMALGIRMVLIWMILIFSPLMALEFVSDGKFVKGFLSKAKFDKGLLNGLVGLAFMPAVAGLVLSVGFIIFHVLTKVIYRTTTFTGNGTQTFNLPPFNIEISGGILPMFSTLGEFIIACILLIVLWQALFQMMQTNKYMDSAINKIDKLGRTIAGSAKMIPFIPMPGPKQRGDDGKPKSGPPKLMSWAGLQRGTEVMERGIEQHHIDDANAEVDGSWFGRFKPQYGGGADDLAKLRKNMNDGGSAKSWKEDRLEIPIKILTDWHGQQADDTRANEMQRNLLALAERIPVKERRDEYVKAVNTWRSTPGDQNAALLLGKALGTSYEHMDNEMKTVMAKYGITHSGYDIRGTTAPTPTPNGPQTIPTSKTHETKDPVTGNVTDYSINVRNTVLNGGTPVDLNHVPESEMRVLETSLRAYATTPTVTTLGTLDGSLLTILGHGGITTFPAALTGPTNGPARQKLAEEIVNAAAKPLAGHAP